MIVRIIKLIISSIFYWGDQFWRLMLKTIGIKSQTTCMVLYYHSINKDHCNKFARQMDEALKFARPISADIKGPVEKGAHHVVITFDDGFISVINNAFPELIKRKIPLTIFVPTGYLGKRPGWINNKENKSFKEVVITEDQLKKLKNDELISIGSHCVTHSNLLLLKEQEIKKELTESKHILEEILEEDVKLLSFPHGAYNQKILELAREVGYERVFTILPKLTFLNSDSYIFDRVNIELTDWIWEFRLKMLGAYRWLPFFFNLKAKMKRLTYWGRQF